MTTIHCKKRFTSFLSPAGTSLTKLPLGRNNSVMTSLFPPRESLVVTSRLGTGNSRTFFLRCKPHREEGAETETEEGSETKEVDEWTEPVLGPLPTPPLASQRRLTFSCCLEVHRDWANSLCSYCGIKLLWYFYIVVCSLNFFFFGIDRCRSTQHVVLSGQEFDDGWLSFFLRDNEILRDQATLLLELNA